MRLGLEERETIAIGLAREEPFAQIARRLGRPTSTVSREVAGHGGKDRYRATAAEREARWHRRRPKKRKFFRCPALAARVSEGLEQRWSPGQIATRLRREFPDDAEARVSHETIYASLYCQGRGGLRKGLISALRSGRARRRPRSRGEQARRRPRSRGEQARRHNVLGDMVPISERPPEVADRAVPGHWEGDLIMGAFNRSAILTLVERATRYTLLGDLPGGHSASEVYACLMELIPTLPANLARSLTWDQGKEMAMHARSPSTLAFRCTSAIRTRHGNGPPTRTPTGCCASTSPRARTSIWSPRTTLTPSPSSSTVGPESCFREKRRRRHTLASLQWPLDAAPDAPIDVNWLGWSASGGSRWRVRRCE